MRILSFLAILTLFFGACSSNKQDKQLLTEVKSLTAQRTGLPSLSYFQSYPNSSVTEIPENYVPKKHGAWDYSKVYLFTQQGTDVVMELYEFSSQEALERAVPTLNCDKWEDDSDGRIKCSGGGALCACDGSDLPCVILSID